jgi:hypothetical protein
MNLLTLLRTLVLGEVLLALTAGFLDYFFPGLFPEAWREFLDFQSSQDWTVLDWASVLFSLVALISLVGLWLLKNWGRSLYTLTTIGSCALAPFLSPTVMSAIAGTLDELSLMCSGGILVLIWFSNLKDQFAPDSPLRPDSGR